MSILPNISASTLQKARQVWNESIDNHGRDIELFDQDDVPFAGNPVKAFVKRPKIMGLFDRTEQSYDQEKYMVLLKAESFPEGVDPEKFMRARWDDEDHVFITTTKVDLSGTVFGYRVLVKG